MSAPMGVKVVAGFSVLSGIITVVMSGFSFFQLHSPAYVALDSLSVLIGAVCIVLGFGLRRLRSWARVGMMLVLGLGMAAEVVGVLRLGKFATRTQNYDALFSIVIGASVIWYLSGRDVAEMFRATGQKLDAA